MLVKIAWKSLLHRRTTVLLTLFSIAISVMLAVGIDHLRHQLKNSFTSTLSGTDLVVGARSGRINLLLYSVFRIGNATNNISWESYQKIKQQKGVKWTIPLSLGDSHEGYRVLGTTEDYFSYYRYGQKQLLSFQAGQPFKGVYDAVLGAEVAKQLGYSLGESIIISHGIAKASFSKHDDKPFTVTGILAPTGTPVDRTIHVSLAGIEAIHIGWQNGVPALGKTVSVDEALQYDLTPKNITAFLLGLDNRILTFRLQRQINNYRGEPLMAILPGVVLSELWQSMSLVEKTLTLISLFVVAASLLGMLTMILSTLAQRQQELFLLRTAGAPTWVIFSLIQLEVLLITCGGIIAGLLLLWFTTTMAAPLLMANYGLSIDTLPYTISTLYYSVSIIIAAQLLACIPAWGAYKRSSPH